MLTENVAETGGEEGTLRVDFQRVFDVSLGATQEFIKDHDIVEKIYG